MYILCSGALRKKGGGGCLGFVWKTNLVCTAVVPSYSVKLLKLKKKSVHFLLIF